MQPGLRCRTVRCERGWSAPMCVFRPSRWSKSSVSPTCSQTTNCFFAIAFDFLPQLDITAEVLNRAIKTRQQFRLKTPDAVVAATALAHGLELVTADAGFTRVAGLTIVNPILTT